MYRYTVKKDIIKRSRTYGYGKHTTSDYFRNEIRPLIPSVERTYSQWGDFQFIKDFCFYSKKKLTHIQIGSSLFPVILCDVVKLE